MSVYFQNCSFSLNSYIRLDVTSLGDVSENVYIVIIHYGF